MYANKRVIQKWWVLPLLLQSLNVAYAINPSPLLPIKKEETDGLRTTHAVSTNSSSMLHALWGVPANDPTLALGMWSYHLKKEQDDMDNSRNDLIGLAYRGVFVGTLVNSQRRRSYVIGLQRYWRTETIGQDLKWQLGYRLGLIYGYDRKFGRIAEQIPVLPFPQVISDLTWKHFGWELSYTWVVVSTSFYYRF
ncbi:MAG: hypothetical protein P4M14_05890 [Gammaproteobacteria bacterium]|nr:hypothetical protein [Gammaproteobacteria bacterium]